MIFERLSGPDVCSNQVISEPCGFSRTSIVRGQANHEVSDLMVRMNVRTLPLLNPSNPPTCFEGGRFLF